jgi:hypothetical protein
MINTAVVSIEDFGAVGNGVADDTAAFNAFNAFAIALPANTHVQLDCLSGKTYMIANPYWPCNIRSLEVNGNGSKFKNNATVNVNKALLIPAFGTSSTGLGSIYTPVNRYLINDTSPGVQQIVTTTPANAGNFTAGEMVMVASFDNQFSGAPPNMRYFEYLTIETVNPATGVITLKERIKYFHSASFPYTTIDARCDGRAHVYKIEQGSLFNINHVYNDMEFVVNDVNSGGATSESPYAQGYSVTFNRCKASAATYSSGFLPTASENITFNNCLNNGDLEVDKLITNLSLNTCIIDGACNAATSVVNFKAVDTKFVNGYNMCPQNMTLVDCESTGSALMYGAYGCVDYMKISGGVHTSLPNYSVTTGQIQEIVINGSTVVWNAPNLTLNLSVEANRLFVARAYFGKKIFVTNASFGQEVPTGVFGTIATIGNGGSASQAVIQIQFSGVLAGTERLVIYQEPRETIIENVTVNVNKVDQDFVKLVSNKAIYFFTPGSIPVNQDRIFTAGAPTRVVIDVIRPYTGSTAGNILLELKSVDPYVGTRLNKLVDLKTAGRRESTTLAFAGWTGAAGESAGSVLSSGSFSSTFLGLFSIFFPVMASASSVELPILSVTVEVDGPLNYNVFQS